MWRPRLPVAMVPAICWAMHEFNCCWTAPRSTLANFDFPIKYVECRSAVQFSRIFWTWMFPLFVSLQRNCVHVLVRACVCFFPTFFPSLFDQNGFDYVYKRSMVFFSPSIFHTTFISLFNSFYLPINLILHCFIFIFIPLLSVFFSVLYTFHACVYVFYFIFFSPFVIVAPFIHILFGWLLYVQYNLSLAKRVVWRLVVWIQCKVFVYAVRTPIGVLHIGNKNGLCMCLCAKIS